jgi:two-component system, OmpR family, response regulator
VLEVGDFRLDPATRQVWRGTADGEVLTRDYLLEQAWDMGYDNRSNVIAVYMDYLRDKIDRPFGARSLETVRGAGDRLRANA